MKKNILLLLSLVVLLTHTHACSILYYIDSKTGHIFVANNEDYFYDVKPYIMIEPKKGKHLGRVWYGWKNFAQGGVNEAGLFFDGASTPELLLPNGYNEPRKNIGDEILASCRTVGEALAYLETHHIALRRSHLFFGDSTGHALVVEWIDGKKIIAPIKNNRLMATNFLLSDTSRGNFPCPRYHNIQQGLNNLDKRAAHDTITLKDVGNVMATAVQLPQQDDSGRTGGTLYSTFIDLTAMQFVLIYKLDNARIYRINLKTELASGKSRKIVLK